MDRIRDMRIQCEETMIVNINDEFRIVSDPLQWTVQKLPPVTKNQTKQIGRAHVCTPVTDVSRMPSSA